MTIKRTFYVVQNSNEQYLKGFNKDKNQVEFTSDIEHARFYTHSKAITPRIGERILRVVLNVRPEDIEISAS